MLFTPKFKIVVKIAAFALIAASLLFLFIPFEAKLTEKIVSRPGYNSGMRTVISTEHTYGEKNFFEYMEGHGGALEYIFVVVLALCAIAIAVSFFFKPAEKVFFALLPLLALVLYIAVLVRSDTSYSLGISKPVQVAGRYLHTEISIRYTLSILPAIATALAMLAQVFVGVIDIIGAKRATASAEAAESDQSDGGADGEAGGKDADEATDADGAGN